ncbi:MAG TPA: hypothetical protein VEO19_16160 [Terriglobia bacterium]|nr:hypothetical protein [Terriglobia bacterium]
MQRVGFFLLASLAFNAVPGVAATHTEILECPAGAHLWFKLRGGDVHIKPGEDPAHIVVRYTPDTRKPEQEKNVQLRWRTHGSTIQVEIRTPISLSVDAELEVPSPLSLEVHMTGGDLTVERVEGDKNLQLFAGDLKVDVGSLQSLREAEVSTRVGDADVPSAGTQHGWLGHTWKYYGNGPYRLYAHTTFGDATLVAKQGLGIGD